MPTSMAEVSRDVRASRSKIIQRSTCTLVRSSSKSSIYCNWGSDVKEPLVILVGKDCRENEELKAAVKVLELDQEESDTGLDLIRRASEIESVFILNVFEGEVYHKLLKAEARIIGPPIVFQCAKNKCPIPFHSRPLYCTAMQGVITCFTGFNRREELAPLADLLHHMGGSVRKEITTKVTHLVANSTEGEKYRFAVSFGTPIMSSDWLYRVWEERNNLGVKGTDTKLMVHRVPPFYKCCLSFLGFSKEEQKHMEELTIENGGTCGTVGDDESTHLVVDDQSTKELPHSTMLPHYVVKAEWFWGSIQMEACADENLLEYQKVSSSASSIFTPGRCMSGSKSRKRKRLKENIAQLAGEGDFDSPLYKRRSSEMGRTSMSPSSFLDASNTPDKSDYAIEDQKEKVSNISMKTTPRHQVVMEFLQTEKNYVGILSTILTVFKAEVEKTNQYSGALLAPQHVKVIFGNIPPIYDVHCQISEELQSIVENWSEDKGIGDVILKHADALLKAYPPFVNYFEQTKETIAKCDKTNPRFHAFLKVCQSKPECGRQTLTELLIRPVQRLPSISLLLNDIMKHTPKDNIDNNKLEKATNILKEVMTHINEDKRKTENQVVMFEIMNDIDNCPPTLLSSHRRFVTRIDVIELSDELCGRGMPLSLFLFTDSVELCKRRSRYLNSSKSPALLKTPQKALKHLTLIPLAAIKRVIDCVENDDCRNSFGVIVKSNSEMTEKLFSFMVDGEESKKEFMTQLTKSISHIVCMADHESLMVTVVGRDLHINTSELGKHSISKAARLGKRVSRAFSFNKTPGRLKRAVSSVSHAFSPFADSRERYLGTPRGNLQGKRLASCMDLTDSISPTLSSFASSTTLYDESDTISLGAYSLKELP
ncbi:protein ECT2-like isoform X1 [Pecten maximus]|uniref:protein ECT2-like isoform X1 n=1 Tax=Pecten maximus TaxID=6579 RepID=UPI0014589279|nr:protein ECT2-like isoform X1 [Pecten maximus]